MNSLRGGIAGILALSLGALGAACGGDDDGGGGSGQGGAAGGPMTVTGAGGGTTTTTGGGGAGGTGSGGAGAGGAPSMGTFMGMACNGNTCDLTLVGQGFSAHDGMTIHAGIVPQGSQDGFTWQSSATVAGGSFMMDAPGALTKGTVYNLHYYVDINGNGSCDATPTDHVWRTSLPPIQEHLTATLVHDTNFVNLGCGNF